MAAYMHTLGAPFLMDDLSNIVHNDYIKIETLTPETLSYVWRAPQPVAHRQLAYLSFALNYLAGELDPLGYHLVNLFFLMGCGLLTVLFFHQTLGAKWLNSRFGDARFWICWGAGLLWALHPLQINSVTYMVQRMNSMAVFFSLVALTLWMAGLSLWRKHRLCCAVICWLFGLVTWILGLHCKQHVAIVPLLAVIHYVFLIKQGKINMTWRRMSAAIIATFTTASIVFFSLGLLPLRRIIGDYTYRNFDMTERLMTESRVLWHYVSLFYAPAADRFSLIYDYPVSRGLFSPPTTILSILLWAGVIVVIWFFRKRRPVLSWMAAWYVTSHLIESSVIPLEIIFEHRMLLPSIALSLGSILLGFDFISRRMNRPKLLIALLGGVLLVTGHATYIRNMDFRDAVTFYRSEHHKYPNSRRIRLNLALSLNASGNITEGGKRLESLARNYPDDIQIHQNWYHFLVYSYGIDSRRAESAYHHIIRLLDQGKFNPPADTESIWGLALFFQKYGKPERALFLVEYLLTLYNHDHMWLMKGICHAALNDWDSAVQAFHRAWKLNQQNPLVLYWYGKGLLRLADYDKGCKFLIKASQSRLDRTASRLSVQLLEKQCKPD